LNSTPHTPDGADHELSEEDGVYWFTEHPEPGVERKWTQLCRPYTEDVSDRERIAAAIDRIRWHRLDDSVPFSAGLILRELIGHASRAGLRPLAMGIGPDPIDYPEPHLLDRPRAEVHPGFFETGYLVALRHLASRTSFSASFLVLNDKAGQVAFDIDDRLLPEGLLTRACAARLHELCKGVIGEARCECPCGNAGR
jgi:hypothetical protein